MMEFLYKFTYDEDGAITVDWVVLTASMVALALATVATVRTGIFAASANMATSMANIDLGSTP
ncbi:hypothetical protein MNBD_ALPHA07-1564 [hydrothermal vent metagenome]|uniref:Flp pilus assembly protein, pilin Flp n=1 Tax=hydrothermal vent metagenome TaxID=652676 RepID=A0A3B0SP54_9ZZZZ